MRLVFTYETSFERESKRSDIQIDSAQLKSLNVVCMSPRFDPFFKMRSPNYRTEEKTYTHRDVELTTSAMYLAHGLKLDLEKYLNTKEGKLLFAQDALVSLDTIGKVEKIEDFDPNTLHADFKLFFRQTSWL